MSKKNILTQSKKKKALELAQAGNFVEAKKTLVQLCQIDKMDAENWFMLGVVNGKLENALESVDSFQKVIALRPSHALAHYNLGIALQGNGQLSEAVDAFRAAAQHEPNQIQIYGRLGHLLIMLGRLDEALICYRELQKLSPNEPGVHGNLGAILYSAGNLEEAVAEYRQELRLYPDIASVYDNLASALSAQGKCTEAISTSRQSLRLNPGAAQAHSNLLLTMHYLSEQEPKELFSEHQNWAKIHARPLATLQSYTNSCKPKRPLRIGYMSSDFRAHSVTFFFEPLLANHDSSVVETVCYSGGSFPDATTHRIKGLTGKWREIGGLQEDQVERMVRADEIDILVDLAGHTAGNFLTVFSRKPAPIQVTYLGYPDTTGLHAIDYRLTDTLADPEGQDVFYTEKLVRLPEGFLCYRPLADSPPVAPLPALENKYVTFGSFNNLAKINPEVIALWAELLQAVPNARLFVKNPSLTDEATRERYYCLFEEHGATRERVELRGRTATQAEHLALYRQLDIALDTFPYNGTTTTCEALWMGVPVITLVGTRHAGRVGLSLLANVGRKEWCAETREQYISIATGLAADLQRLASLRAGLREYMASSPLCDDKNFARTLEMTYQDMWRAWCLSKENAVDSGEAA